MNLQATMGGVCCWCLMTSANCGQSTRCRLLSIARVVSLIQWQLFMVILYIMLDSQPGMTSYPQAGELFSGKTMASS